MRYLGIPAWNQGAARRSPSSGRMTRLSVRSGSGGGVGVAPANVPVVVVPVVVPGAATPGTTPEAGVGPNATPGPPTPEDTPDEHELIWEMRFDLRSLRSMEPPCEHCDNLEAGEDKAR